MSKANDPATNAALDDDLSGVGDDGFQAGIGETDHDRRAESDAAAVVTEHKEVDIEMILDVPVTLAMEVGHTKMSIRNLMQLGRGSVVELDRLAGEPMDVKVNGVLVAHGEVVVVNEKFGIRLTDVVRPAEWIRKLK